MIQQSLVFTPLKDAMPHLEVGKKYLLFFQPTGRIHTVKAVAGSVRPLAGFDLTDSEDGHGFSIDTEGLGICLMPDVIMQEEVK